MKLDIRTKLVLVSLVVIGVSIFAVESFVRREIESEIVASVRADLFERLALIGSEAERRGVDASDTRSWCDSLKSNVVPNESRALSFGASVIV